jgi:hypothetical protein
MDILNNMARKLNGFFSEMERQDGKIKFYDKDPFFRNRNCGGKEGKWGPYLDSRAER